MSIKFKQNGEWVKIPTPSQIDDTAASSATTYSSNKINEIIPKDIAEYIEEHKDEIGTTDFTKLKNMPFTLVSKDDTRFSSFDNLYTYNPDSSSAKLLVEPGAYVLEDDMSFTGNYCMDYMSYAVAMLNGEESPEESLLFKLEDMTLPKNTTIYVKKDTMYINCGVETSYNMRTSTGSSGGSGVTFNFVAINYDEDHGAACFILPSGAIESEYNYFEAIWYTFLSNTMSTSFKEGQAVVAANSYTGSGSLPLLKLADIGVPATNITDDNYKNYQTMDQWFALDDGMYLVNTDKLSITVEGKNKLYSAQAKAFDELVGIAETYSKSLDIPKGNYIAVYTTKAGGTFYNKYKMMVIYQDKADPSSEESNVPSAGVSVVITLGSASGSGTSFIKDVKVYDFNQASVIQSILNTYMGSVFLPLLGDKSTTGYDAPTEGQIAQWHGDLTNGFKLAGVDKDSISPIKVITESDRLNYNTLDALCHLSDGVYMYTGTTAIELTYKSADILRESIGEEGTQEGSSVVYNETIYLENGTLFSISPNTSNSDRTKEKSIVIISGIRPTSDEYAGSIYIDANPDSGSGTEADPYVYGTTGKGCITYPVNSLANFGGQIGLSLFKGLFGETPTDGQVAQFKTDSTSPLGVTIQGADVGSSVPITVINAENYENFTTLQGILDHPDGMYLVDDCGVTGGDAQLTIESFKGHAIQILLMSMTQFQTVVEGPEIMCYKGSTISILTDGEISKGATRYISICNTPCGVSGEGDPDDPSRVFPGAGTSIVKIEIHAVEDRSSGKVVYSYDIDGGTKTLFTYPAYDSMLNMYTTGAVAGGILTGKSSYTPGQLVGVVQNTDNLAGYNFTGVDASVFKSPFTLITNDNADNYNTLDKLCHLDDGLYLCKDTYNTTKKDYIVEVSFKGIELLEAWQLSMAGDDGSSVTPRGQAVYCKNGAIISVATQTNNSKNKVVRITHGLNGDTSTSHGNLFEDVYIIASPDDSSASTLVYGVTGTGTMYYQPMGWGLVNNYAVSQTILQNAYYDSDIVGKMAVWEKINDNAACMKLGYADIPSALVGASTAVTPAQVKSSVETGQPVSVSHTDSTYGTLTFTGFGIVTTASGSTVSASITYGTATDSFMLFTLMGDVTKGTWTMYSRSVPTSEAAG